MTMDNSKLLHDLRSKCSSLKSAAELFKDCSAAEKKEMLALMNSAAAEIGKLLGQLEKTL
jgi:CHAD domain-containing protein